MRRAVGVYKDLVQLSLVRELAGGFVVDATDVREVEGFGASEGEEDYVHLIVGFRSNLVIVVRKLLQALGRAQESEVLLNFLGCRLASLEGFRANWMVGGCLRGDGAIIVMTCGSLVDGKGHGCWRMCRARGWESLPPSRGQRLEARWAGQG